MATLTLGSVTFEGLEIPGKVNIPGKHKLAKNTLIGGARQPDAMGPDDGNIKWSGILLGADAQERSTALQGMKDAGIQIPFLMGGEYRIVIIEECNIDYRFDFEIYYEIDCYVVSNPANGLGSAVPSLVQSLTATVGIDASAITAITALAPASPGLAAASLATGAVTAAGNIDAASPIVLSGLVPPLNAAVATLQGEVSSAEGVINAQPAGASPVQFAASLVAIGGALNAQVAKTAVINHANRMVKNLINAGAS